MKPATAADTSTVVAAFASWHEHHNTARDALDAGLSLIEHCALETYSVLTRLPAPHRCSGALVREFLSARFPDPYLRLNPRGFKQFVVGLDNHHVRGGSAYDALVAATAAANDVRLLTCDHRASRIYDAYGVEFRFL